MKAIILAIETSCDETAAAVIAQGRILSNVVRQQAIHASYGGVVPELAARDHQKNIIPIVHKALQDAHITQDQLHAIAFTQGPGLLGSLLVGTSFAKALAFGLGIPIIAVNHMKAHILAHFITAPQPPFPFLCLTVSGGHTQLVHVKDYTTMQLIGETLDDAMGEAFDKIANLMGFAYPGGPTIDAYAQQGDPTYFQFPITKIPGLNFSFSGIKTAFRYLIEKNLNQDPLFIQKNKHHLCASIQATLIAMALEKLNKAVEHTGINTVALAGGVAANTGLSKQLKAIAKQKAWNVFIPPKAYCTDNAAMIAITAHYQYIKNDFCDLSITPIPNMPLSHKTL